MKYSTDWLREQPMDSRPEYIFFWGHTVKNGMIDKTCFSQWYPSPFIVGNIRYTTAEHWMMAGKARLFSDEEQLKMILSDESPAIAKKAGRAVKNFDNTKWETHAWQLVVDGNYHKFSQNPSLKDFLLATGNKIIAEASPFDKIWGIGTQKHETDPGKWEGTNLLGFALMEVRDLFL